MTANRVLELQKRFIENGKNPKSGTWEDYLSIFMYLSVIELRGSPHVDREELRSNLSLCSSCTFVTLCLSDMIDAGIIYLNSEKKIYFKETDEVNNAVD
jgi:hypothetical protein